MEERITLSLLLRNIGAWFAERKEVRKRRYELVWFTWDCFFNFGYEFHRRGAMYSNHLDSEECCNIHFNLLGLFSLYVYFDIPQRWVSSTSMYRKLHVALDSEQLYISWTTWPDRDDGDEHSKCKIFYYPWRWEFVEKRFLSPDRTLSMFVPLKWEEMPKPLDSWIKVLPFTYKWKTKKYDVERGEDSATEYEEHVQETQATVYIESMEWKRLCFPFIRMKKILLEVSFAQGMGPQRGGWKGGITGMSFAIKPGETIEQCVTRMQTEVVFR